MTFNLLTRFYFLTLLLCTYVVNAQITTDSINSEKQTETQKTHLNLEISGVVPNAIGDNFASKGFDFKYGIDFNFKGYFNNNLFFGLRFQHLRADVKNTTLVGVFEYSNVNSYIASVGYRFEIFDKFDLEPSIGLGATIYNNKKTSTSFDDKIDFNDEATSLIISLPINYRLKRRISFFVKPEYRIDFTEIKTASSRQDFFDEAHYMNILIGLRIGY